MRNRRLDHYSVMAVNLLMELLGLEKASLLLKLRLLEVELDVDVKASNMSEHEGKKLIHTKSVPKVKEKSK